MRLAAVAVAVGVSVSSVFAEPTGRAAQALSPTESSEGAGAAAVRGTGCEVYERLNVVDRTGCLIVDGLGLWVHGMVVAFTASRTNTGSDTPYTYVAVRYVVERPNGQGWFGTGDGSVTVLDGYAQYTPIDDFVEAGNWCLRFQLRRNSGVWEPWRQTCTPVRD